MKQLFEKYREKRKERYFAIINQEMAYDKICRKTLWRVLHECGVEGYLIKNMCSFYDGSSAYVRLDKERGSIFLGREVIETGFVMSPWLIDIFLNIVIRR